MSGKFDHKIREYAKKLFLTVDENGKRLYSLQKIADKIQTELGIKISRNTIHKWAIKYDWELEEPLIQKAIVKKDEGSQNLKTKLEQLLSEWETDEELFELLIKAKRKVIFDMIETADKLKRVINKHLEENKLDHKIARYIEAFAVLEKELGTILSGIAGSGIEENKNAVIIINEINTNKANEDNQKDETVIETQAIED